MQGPACTSARQSRTLYRMCDTTRAVNMVKPASQTHGELHSMLHALCSTPSRASERSHFIQELGQHMVTAVLNKGVCSCWTSIQRRVSAGQLLTD